MSERKITVELTEAQLISLVHHVGDPEQFDPTPGDTEDAIEVLRAAMPPEYADGDLAWVTAGSGHVRSTAFYRGGKWWIIGGSVTSDLEPVHKVEPLRILGDDELAVKPPQTWTPAGLREIADDLAAGRVNRPLHYLARFLRGTADAMEAQP